MDPRRAAVIFPEYRRLPQETSYGLSVQEPVRVVRAPIQLLS